MLSSVERDKVAAYRVLMAHTYELAAVSRRDSESFARTIGMTTTQWHTMSAISEQDASVPQIAARLGVTRQAVQRVVDQLLSTGHVEKIANPKHDSSPLIRLSATGTRTLRQLWLDSDEPRAALLSELTTTELTAAADTLSRLLGAFADKSG